MPKIKALVEIELDVDDLNSLKFVKKNKSRSRLMIEADLNDFLEGENKRFVYPKLYKKAKIKVVAIGCFK